MDKNELNSLLQLMDDPDEAVYRRIRQLIIDQGKEVVPMLEHAWENSFDEVTRGRLEEIIHTINFQHVKNQLTLWKFKGGEDLIEGALLISKYRYPSLDLDSLYREVGTLVQDIWLEMNERMSPLDKVRVINHIFFDVYGFKGLKIKESSLSNVFLHQTLQLKRGGPTTLGILYLGIAQTLNLPVYGLDWPYYLPFSLSWLEFDPGHFIADPSKDQVLFYISPYYKGIAFSRRDLDKMLRDQQIDPDPQLFKPCSNIMVVERLVKEVRHIFKQENQVSFMEEMDELVNILRGDVSSDE
ncbi:MAG: transglutaminase-like domain-containing protein [Bacteroidales bacterium]